MVKITKTSSFPDSQMNILLAVTTSKKYLNLSQLIQTSMNAIEFTFSQIPLNHKFVKTLICLHPLQSMPLKMTHHFLSFGCSPSVAISTTALLRFIDKRFLTFHAGISVRLHFSTDVLIFCDYPRLPTFLSLLFHMSVKAQQNWKLNPRSYENKTKSIWPGVKFSCLQPSLFLHHLSPYFLLPFPFISNLLGLLLPCFFLLTICLFTNVLSICIFPLYPLLVSFPSPCILQPMRRAAGHAAGTCIELWNKHDLPTYKEEPRNTEEQFLNWKRVLLLLSKL